MKTVDYFEIVIRYYNGQIYARLRFHNGKEIEESSFETIAIVNGILPAWRAGNLCGSFAIGSILAHDAKFQLCME